MPTIELHLPAQTVVSAAATIRRACVDDVEHMATLINDYAAQGLMLPKTTTQLYHHVRDFLVAEANGRIVGCAGLKITWRDLAEIVSLAVAPDFQGQGLGRKLVLPLLEDARALKMPTVFALTYQVAFFGKLGFVIVPKETLSQKVWQDCIVCPKQHHCDEIAMIHHIQA